VTHPPEVPDEAVVIAGIARERVAEMDGKRPRPGNRQYGEQQNRREMLRRRASGATTLRVEL
jgi:hypothetical protein